MSSGYIIFFYKNNMLESYIRNILMTKYISLNNSIGSEKLISKIKYYHRNYFCFINKDKISVRCILKLIKITNYQFNIEIKSQQEISLTELKQCGNFNSDIKSIENFFNLETGNPNSINLIIKESNNVYEFNCLLLESSINMEIVEKVLQSMKEKEKTQNNEIRNNLRNNLFVSDILNFQNAVRKKKLENTTNNNTNSTANTSGNLNYDGGKNMGIEGDANIKIKQGGIINNFFDMKYGKYYLYDELLIDKNEERNSIKMQAG